jgi:hypothetical protein
MCQFFIETIGLRDSEGLCRIGMLVSWRRPVRMMLQGFKVTNANLAFCGVTQSVD